MNKLNDNYILPVDRYTSIKFFEKNQKVNNKHEITQSIIDEFSTIMTNDDIIAMVEWNYGPLAGGGTYYIYNKQTGKYTHSIPGWIS